MSPSPFKTCLQVLSITLQAEGNYPFPQTAFLENLFPQIAERRGRNYDLLCQIQLENMKMTWNTRLFIFCLNCNFFKYDDFRFFLQVGSKLEVYKE